MYSYCTDDQIKEFYSEFGATEESVDRDVKYLMEWLEKQPHLPNVKGKFLYIFSQEISVALLRRSYTLGVKLFFTKAKK